MTVYGYIRTSVASINPESQGLQLRTAGVQQGRIFQDVAVSGRVGATSRDGWYALNDRLQPGDTLVVAALDRIGREWISTSLVILDLRQREIRIRTLAEDETWAVYLNADPDTPEYFIGHQIASQFAWSAAQQLKDISRRTKAGLARARAEGKTLGRPRVMSEEMLEVAKHLRGEGQSLRVIGRTLKVSPSTVRGALAQ